MKEESIKIIEPKEEIPSIKNLTPIEPIKQNKKDIITKLPEWSIEPPIEIKRGN